MDTKIIVISKKTQMTLCIVHDHPRVLLGMKKRGFGAGRWNGFGGKVMDGESVESAVKREMKEESGLDVINIDRLGILEFTWANKKDVLEVHVFKCKDAVGQAIESDEMRPEWFFVDEIPFEKMWPDDIYWFPIFLKDKKFRGKFHFDESDRIISKEIEQITYF